VDEKFNEEETKFKMLEGAVKNIARDISLYLERLDVSICTDTFACWRRLCGVAWHGVFAAVCSAQTQKYHFYWDGRKISDIAVIGIGIRTTQKLKNWDVN